MIRLENLNKSFFAGNTRKVVADNISATFPSGKSIGLLGRNGAGKTTMLKMIAGTVMPTSGRITSTGTISYPVGFSGSFHRDLTGRQNAVFVARIYGVDTDELCDFVEEFAQLGPHYRMPIRTYSAGMKSRLAFGISMGIDFDTYLVDEVTSVGDAGFKSRSAQVFKERMETSGAIVVTHSPGQLRELCDAGAVLDNGKLRYFDDIEEAVQCHESNMR